MSRDLWIEGATEVENIIIIMPAATSAGIQGRDFTADGEVANTAGCSYDFPHHSLSLLEQASPLDVWRAKENLCWQDCIVPVSIADTFKPALKSLEGKSSKGLSN